MVMDLELNVIKYDDIKPLELFLTSAGSSLASFRYFEKRPLSVINNHLITCIVTYNNLPVGYGHLDIDGETTWLGIAVAETFKGKGIGKYIMQYLIKKASESKVKMLSLSVDKNNTQAIGLYTKFGFEYIKDINDQSVLMQCKL